MTTKKKTAPKGAAPKHPEATSGDVAPFAAFMLRCGVDIEALWAFLARDDIPEADFWHASNELFSAELFFYNGETEVARLRAFEVQRYTDQFDLMRSALNTSRTNSKNAKKPRAKRIDEKRIKTAFKRLVDSGKSRREANGKLFEDGLGSRPSIRRVTDDLPDKPKN